MEIISTLTDLLRDLRVMIISRLIFSRCACLDIASYFRQVAVGQRFSARTFLKGRAGMRTTEHTISL